MSNVEEKKKTKKKLIITISIIAVIGVAALGIVFSGLVNGFDAKAYTEAVLRQNFRGETAALSTMVEGATEEELTEQYEKGVVTFVENNITGGIAVDEELQKKYYDLGKKIFAELKFEVKEAERISRNEYRVPVEYQSTNLFTKFKEATNQELKNCNAKMEKGEYKGTFDEINMQMQTEFVSNCYTQLENLVKDMSYLERTSVIFTVKKDENGVFGLDSKELSQFMEKILGLDAIQD